MRTVLIAVSCLLLAVWAQPVHAAGGLQGAITPVPGSAQPPQNPPPVTPPSNQNPAPNMDAEQLFQTGEDHYYGRGVPENYAEAANWYRQAAQFGHAEALYSLGYLYAYGQGVPQDHRQAADWFQQAAEQNHMYSMGELGSLYWNGDGVPQDYSQAAYWHRQAADLGLSSSMVNYAILLDEGRGVNADYASAAYYLVTAFVYGDDSARDWLFNSSDSWHIDTRRQVQVLLRNAGVYSGAIDGAIGPGSRNALEAYRRQQGG